MATAKFDIKTEALKPVYAYVGVTDLVVEKARDYVADAQKRAAAVQKDVNARVADVQKTDPKVLRDRAVKVVNARVEALAKDAQARRTAIEARVADLQAAATTYPGKVQGLADELVDDAGEVYVGLVKRGETLVGRIRRQKATQDTKAAAKTTVTKAKTTTTQAKKAASAEKTATKQTVTAAKTAAKKAAKKAPARKAATKKTATAASSAKATATAAKKTTAAATKAVADAAEKVGD